MGIPCCIATAVAASLAPPPLPTSSIPPSPHPSQHHTFSTGGSNWYEHWGEEDRLGDALQDVRPGWGHLWAPCGQGRLPGGAGQPLRPAGLRPADLAGPFWAASEQQAQAARRDVGRGGLGNQGHQGQQQRASSAMPPACAPLPVLSLAASGRLLEAPATARRASWDVSARVAASARM